MSKSAQFVLALIVAFILSIPTSLEYDIEIGSFVFILFAIIGFILVAFGNAKDDK